MQIRSHGDYNAAAAFEHRFWLHVLRDHATFIFNGLSPQETEEIAMAQHYMDMFSDLLERANASLNDTEWQRLSEQAAAAAGDLRQFKLHLLRRKLVGQVGFNLSASLLDHMVNELDEYERLLACLMEGIVPPPAHPLHHHLLWLSDAAGHAAVLQADIDPAEADFQKRSAAFEAKFNAFYLKAVTLAGFLRTNLDQFPALARFNRQAELETHVFEAFLEEVLELNVSDELLSVIAPLLADHMLREASYYMQKLTEVTHVPPQAGG